MELTNLLGNEVLALISSYDAKKKVIVEKIEKLDIDIAKLQGKKDKIETELNRIYQKREELETELQKIEAEIYKKSGITITSDVLQTMISAALNTMKQEEKDNAQDDNLSEENQDLSAEIQNSTEENEEYADESDEEKALREKRKRLGLG